MIFTDITSYNLGNLDIFKTKMDINSELFIKLSNQYHWRINVDYW